MNGANKIINALRELKQRNKSRSSEISSLGNPFKAKTENNLAKRIRNNPTPLMMKKRFKYFDTRPSSR